MKDIKLLAKIRSHFHILLCLIFVMFLKSPIQMAHNKLYNINCQQAVYQPVYMQPVGCSVVMLHCAAVRTVCCCMVCIQINTYRSGVIKMWMFLTAQGTRSFLDILQGVPQLDTLQGVSQLDILQEFLTYTYYREFLSQIYYREFLSQIYYREFLRYTTGSSLGRYTTGSFFFILQGVSYLDILQGVSQI